MHCEGDTAPAAGLIPPSRGTEPRVWTRGPTPILFVI